MKKYLVAYYVGGGIVKTEIIEVEKDYMPLNDDMKKIKKMIIEQASPNWRNIRYAPQNCGGNVCIATSGKITVEELRIISISRLDL